MPLVVQCFFVAVFASGEEQSEVIKVAELMSKLRQAQELTKRRVAAGQASDSQAEELRLAAFCATTQPETKVESIAHELCEEESEAQKPVSICTQLTERARDSWTELAQVLRRCAPLDEQACALRRSQEAGAVAAAVLSAHLTGHRFLIAFSNVSALWCLGLMACRRHSVSAFRGQSQGIWPPHAALFVPLLFLHRTF